MARWREGDSRLRVERHGEPLGFQAHHGIAMPMDDVQVGIGAPELGFELSPDLSRLGPGKAALSGAEPHQHQLVIFTALELERPPVGPVGHDRIAKVGQGQRPMKSSGIRRGKVSNDLPEESLQVVHVSCLAKLDA
jgi:hypothetical protein